MGRAAVLFGVIAVLLAAQMAGATVISRVQIPPIIIENSVLRLRLLAVQATEGGVSGGSAHATVAIFHNNTEIWRGEFDVLGERIVQTTALPRGIYTVRVSFAGGRTYEDEVWARPPPVPYHMVLMERGFSFTAQENFTIQILQEVGDSYIEVGRFITNNYTYMFPESGRYKVRIIDKWGWTNAQHDLNYWTGCGLDYVWDYGAWEYEPVVSRLPQTTILNIAIPAAIVVIAYVGWRRGWF